MIADRGFRSDSGGCIFAPMSMEMLGVRLKGEWGVTATADMRETVLTGGAR